MRGKWVAVSHSPWADVFGAFLIFNDHPRYQMVKTIALPSPFLHLHESTLISQFERIEFFVIIITRELRSNATTHRRTDYSNSQKKDPPKVLMKKLEYRLSWRRVTPHFGSFFPSSSSCLSDKRVLCSIL